MSATGGDDDDVSPPDSVSVQFHPLVFVHVLIALLAVFAAFALIRSASQALTTIAIGSIFGLALNPLVAHIQRRWDWPRSRSVLLVAAVAVTLVATVVIAMGPRALNQARAISTDLPKTVRQFYDLPLVGPWLEHKDAAAWVSKAAKELPNQVSTQRVSDTVDSIVGGALSTTLVLAFTIAVLLDGEYVVASIRRTIPGRWLGRADEVGHVFYTSIAQYFGGSIAVAALMGIVVLALCLVFGVPLAPLAALWAMITDLIPQIGGFLGGLLLGLLALTQGPFVFVVVLGLYVAYMSLENHVISPTVIGHAVNMSPPTTMVAALVGGAAAGVPGALVAIPLTGAVKQLYLEVRRGQPPVASNRPPLRERVKTVFHRRRAPAKDTDR